MLRVMRISPVSNSGWKRRSIASTHAAQLHSGTERPVREQVSITGSFIGRTAGTVDPPSAGKIARLLCEDERAVAEDENTPISPPAEAEEAAGPGERGRTPSDVIQAVRVRAPTRGNRKLETLIDGVNSDPEVRGWWHLAQVNSERLGMSDHSWVHVQIVLNIALRLLRLLVRAGIEPAMVGDHGMRDRDAEVVVASGALLHDVGMSIHRVDHEAFSLFLAADHIDTLLAGVYDEPERTIVASEALHAIIGHRKGGRPLTLEGGIVRVADALDMEHGRSRVAMETQLPNIHSLSAAAIDEVRIVQGEERTIRVEIAMNNSAGVFQVDELLATKLRGSGLEKHIEVIARIDAEHEKRLLEVYRI
jgi:uncharacterized protein